jgi:hypothetical protein
MNFKTIVLLPFLILYSNLILSQDSLLKYEKVIILDSSYNKSDLFINARQFITDNFIDANQVLTINDKIEGEIGGNGNMRYYPKGIMGSSGFYNIIFKIKIEVRDGKYKYSFYNFTPITIPEGLFGVITYDELYPYKPHDKLLKGWYNRSWKEMKIQIETNILKLIDTLNDSMKSKSKKEEW